MADMPLNIMCQENRFTKTLTLPVQLAMMGSLIAGGPVQLHPWLGPEIHSSMKVKCSSPMLLTGNTPLCMTGHKNKESLYF